MERWERRQLGNSSWVLGQPKPGAVPRKSEVIWRRGSDVTSSILSKAAPPGESICLRVGGRRNDKRDGHRRLSSRCCLRCGKRTLSFRVTEQQNFSCQALRTASLQGL